MSCSRSVAALAVVLFGASARADGQDVLSRPAVAVVSAAGADPLAEALRLEIRNLGFAPVLLTANRDDLSLPQLADIAASVGAVAAVHVRHAPASVEVWMANRSARRIELRDVLIPHGDEVILDGVVAMRAADLVRAALLEVRSAPPPAPPPVVVAAPPPPARRFQFAASAGPLGVWTSGGLGPLAGGALVLRGRGARGFGGGLRLTSAVAPPINVAEGSLDVAVHGLALVAGWGWTSAGGRVAGFLEGGASGAWVHSRATPASGFVATTGDATSVGPFAAAGLGLRLGRHWRLLVELAGGFFPVRTLLEANDRAVSAWGRAFVAVSPALEIAWP